MSCRRIIVTDMDDTLIKAYSAPTMNVKEKWNELFERKDVTVIIATGQRHGKVKDVLVSNDMKLPHYIIANQGTVIFKASNNEVLYYSLLPNDEVAKVVDVFFKNGGTKEFIIICAINFLIAFDSGVVKRYFKKSSQNNTYLVNDIEHYINHSEYSKIMLMCNTRLADKLVEFSYETNTLFAVN